MTYDSSSIYVMDPVGNALVGQHGGLGEIVDVASHQDEIFIVRRGGVRSILRIGIMPEHPPVVAPGT